MSWFLGCLVLLVLFLGCWFSSLSVSRFLVSRVIGCLVFGLLVSWSRKVQKSFNTISIIAIMKFLKHLSFDTFLGFVFMLTRLVGPKSRIMVSGVQGHVH